MSESESRRIGSFVVLDLEASTYRGNKAKQSIAELCMYAFPSTDLETQPITSNLNKLTLLCNPEKLIFPKTSDMSKLDNYMLEHESKFDSNTAFMVTNFLNNMPQPVCLVAHCGFNHDFVILKNSFNKLKLELPSDTLCIDSFRVFWEIDKLREREFAFINKHNDKYPPRSTYKLGNIYKRVFKTDPQVVHQAEADVEILTHLIRVYGKDFLVYAEKHAIPFKDVKI